MICGPFVRFVWFFADVRANAGVQDLNQRKSSLVAPLLICCLNIVTHSITQRSPFASFISEFENLSE
jgi:hypothetical protein